MTASFTKICVCGRVVRIAGITTATCQCGREHVINMRLSHIERLNGENPLGELLPNADLIKI